MSERDDKVHISLPPSLFGLILGAVGVAGLGGGAVLTPAVDKEALKACYDNSRTALEVVAQHGQEFVDVNSEIQHVNDRINDILTQMLISTADRYTATDAARDKRLHDEHEEIQDRRLEQIEREIKK